MLSNETVRKLHEMRLGVMAEAFSAQLEDAQFQAVSFEDRFAMLVDAEWSARKSNRLSQTVTPSISSNCVQKITHPTKCQLYKRHPPRYNNNELRFSYFLLSSYHRPGGSLPIRVVNKNR